MRAHGSQHPHQPVIVERVRLGFGQRHRNQRGDIEPIFVQRRAERGGGLSDGSFLVPPLRRIAYGDGFLEVQHEPIGRAECEIPCARCIRRENSNRPASSDRSDPAAPAQQGGEVLFDFAGPGDLLDLLMSAEVYLLRMGVGDPLRN